MKQRIRRYFIAHADKWLLAAFSGFALFFVLFIYEGFGIQAGTSYSGHGLLFRALVFGGLTSLNFLVNEFVVSRWVSLSKGYHRILWHAWEVWTGSMLTFLLFNYFWNWTEWDWKAYSLILFEYASVMIFPILITRVLAGRFQQKETPLKPSLLVFEADNGKQTFSIHPDKFLYIQSAGNYVEMYFLADREIRTELQRNSLKNIESNFSDSPYLLRCHRSYMINPLQIQRVLKSSKQMEVDLGYGQVIPVSPTYRSQFEKEVSG